MGLVIGLLTLPLLPVRGVEWLAQQVGDLAEDTYYDASRIRAELHALVQALEQGVIGEEEFERAEDQLLDRLRHAQSRPRRI